MSIGIVIATYGAHDWIKLAERARQTAINQTVKADQIEVYHTFTGTLAEARNTTVLKLNTTDCIILDADDGLDSHYVENMLEATGDLRFPQVQKIYPDGRRELVTYKMGDLTKQNFMVIGTLFPKTLFEQVGGFKEEPIFEDWSLWLRMWKCGATIQPSQAIYTATYNPKGRNQQGSAEYWYKYIRERYA